MIMKNLKIKLGLFSLLAVLAASIFLTSCEQSNIITDEQFEDVELATQAGGIGILLPQDITAQGEHAIKAYLKDATAEQFAKHINDYLTMKFLEEKGKLTSVINEFQGEVNFGEINLSTYLSNNEIAELNNSLIDTLEDNNLNLRACYHEYRYDCDTCTTCVRRNVWGQCTSWNEGPCNCESVFWYTWCDGNW